MMKNLLKAIFAHAAGATVRHKGRFSDLTVPVTENTLTKEFFIKWVAPFYMTNPGEDVFREHYSKLHAEISADITQQMLTEFNWRSRIVGGYFAAIKEYRNFEAQIGNLLLRSDVCYAASGYCIALAAFNSEISLQYLKRYLDYYLKQKEFWFDQSDCMAAVAFLDKKNGTTVMQDYVPSWQDFVKNKPNWSLESSIQRFAASMAAIETLRNTRRS